MSVNRPLAERFEQIAVMLDLLGRDRFRVNAHRRAARIIADMSTDVGRLAGDRDALTAIEGIGPKTADKIIEFCTTGRIAEHEKLVKEVPPGLLDLIRIPGLGPRTVHLLWTQLGVTDVAGLKRVIEDGSILTLPRMGEKTVRNLRDSLAFARTSAGRLPLGVAMPIAERIVADLAGRADVERAAFAGSLRRGCETIGDIDILIATNEPSGPSEAFRSMPGIEKVLAAGATKSSVRVCVDADLGRWGGAEEQEGGPSVQVDLRVVAPDAWGAALMYFSGSKAHNVRLRERAIRLGYTLNEYGLFPLDDEDTPPQARGIEPVASESEEAIYSALDLPWIAPEMREDRGEMDLAEPPTLIKVADIKAELHAHTTASDGLLSMDELVAAARAREFHTIAVTDHSRSAIQAGGLSPQRLREQIRAVREADERTSGIRILAGSEVDILSDGRLDYDDDLLGELDVVVASPHVALTQDSAAATRRLIRAIEHPLVRILGHPTGRLVNRRRGLEPAMDEVIAAAIEHNVALEINAHWMRLDLRDTHVRAAAEAGALIAIDCDVHAPDDPDNVRYGVMTARRGWLAPEQCVNTWSARKLHAWLASGRGSTRA